MKFLIVILMCLSIFSCATKENKSSRNDYRKVIRDDLLSFKKCYTDELQNSPDLEGKIVLSWTVDNTGSVQEAKVKSSTLNNKNMESCMLDTLRSQKFPPAPDKTVAEITYPFLFKK